MHSKESNNKKMEEIVNRFEYYQSAVLEKAVFRKVHKTIEHIDHRQAEAGNNQIHYLKQARDGCTHQSYITKSLLTRVAKETLLPKNGILHDVSNSNSKSFLRTETEESSSYIVDVVVTEARPRRIPKFNSHFSQLQKGSSSINSRNSVVNPKDYVIYVIHFPNQSRSWSYYVQKISIKEDRLSSDDESRPLEYSSILCFPQQSWLKRNILSYFETPTQIKQLALISKEAIHRLNLFQSLLAKTLSQIVNQQREQQKNCHPEFKRETHLPPEQYRKFEKIKSEIYNFYLQISPQKKLNHYFLDNLICRYMAVKKYQEKQTISSVKKYLEWQKHLRRKYTFESFNHYHPLKIFEYIGKDYQGRPILFFRADKYLPSLIKDVDEYLDYNSYIIELYLQDHMEGYIDQYILIADYTNFGTDNFKYSIAKQFSEIGNQYFPERQFKLVLFGVGTFGHWIFNRLKSVLPEFIFKKIEIFGTEKEELKNYLMKLMDIGQMPKQVFAEAPTEEGYIRRNIDV